MIVNRANLNGVFTNLRTSFNKAFEAAPALWAKVAMLVPSTTKTEDYKWLSAFPKMREWVGEKVLKSLEAFKYLLTNKDYEATVEVDRNDIEDDSLGIYGPMARSAGESSKQWPDEMVFDVINKGFAEPAYDGQFFFDTDHPVAGVSVSNKGTAQLKFDTLANADASFGAARVAMRQFKDDEGRPLNVVPNLLLVPPALEATANALMKNDLLADGKSNPYKGQAEVVVSNHLASSTAWFLLATNRAIKPFIFQQRKAPVFVQQTNMDSPDVFMKRQFKFGAESRGNAGFGLWQLAYGSDGSV